MCECDIENELFKKKEITHIFIQQRTAKRYVTTIQDLPENANYKLLLAAFTSYFSCGGHLGKSENGKDVIILQGDQRKKVKEFLIKEKIKKQDEIQIHGF